MKLEDLKFNDFDFASFNEMPEGEVVFEREYPITGFKSQEFASSEGTWIRSFISRLDRTSPIHVGNIKTDLEVMFDFGENFIFLVGQAFLIGLIQLDCESFRMQVFKRPQQ